MRVEITHASNVHTSQGKAQQGVRLDLPNKEGELMIARGFAKQVKEKKAGANAPAQWPAFDMGGDTGAGDA